MSIHFLAALPVPGFRAQAKHEPKLQNQRRKICTSLRIDSMPDLCVWFEMFRRADALLNLCAHSDQYLTPLMLQVALYSWGISEWNIYIYI